MLVAVVVVDLLVVDSQLVQVAQVVAELEQLAQMVHQEPQT